MKRRQFLSFTSTAALLGWAPTVQASASGASSFRRVRPGDSGWPSDDAWSQLNGRVAGNLISVPSFISPCSAPERGPECETLVQNAQNPFFIGDQPGGTQVTGWLNAWRPAPSAYAIRARNAADVALGIDFARRHRLRLVVKGAGHSYQGTSNAPDSLLIWTRGMNAVDLHEAFVPEGMEGRFTPCPAVTAQAGCMWIDLYHAVTEMAGRYVQGGGCTDVGVAGLVQSGGFGSFSKGFGLAGSHLLQAEIVTADGEIRTINAASSPDLFWALKGGGGGSWGVVTSLTLRTHDLPEAFGSAWGEVRASSDAAYRELIGRFFDHYAIHLFNPHWGEQVRFAGDNTLKISMCCQGLDGTAARASWADFFAWLHASPEIEVVAEPGAGVMQARHWWSIGDNESLVPDPRPGAPAHHAWWKGDQGQANAFLHAYDSVWLPQGLLLAARRPALVDAVFAASRHNRFSLHFNKGLAGAAPDAIEAARDTAAHPDVLQAFALAIVSAGEGPVFPEVGRNPDPILGAENAGKVSLASAELRKAAPEAGSYLAESDYFIADWQQAFWGRRNYSRLRAIKTRYDPEGLFFGHHGVASENWSSDGFERS